MKKGIILIIVLVLLLGLGYWQRGWIRDAWTNLSAEDVPEVTPRNATLNTNIATNVNAVNASNTNAVLVLPAEINLDVPFTSQAPHANWDLPYQEACEETAALMVHRYWSDRDIVSADDADLGILEIVNFQTEQYGDYLDTTAVETAQFMKDLWGYQDIDVVTGSDVTIERIKQKVAQGRPVIVFAAGRELGNPNFTSPGPLYHALVVKGYTSTGQFITNDPGTRNGADYVYDYDVLLNAIHDWNDGDVANGQKAMIVVQAAP